MSWCAGYPDKLDEPWASIEKSTRYGCRCDDSYCSYHFDRCFTPELLDTHASGWRSSHPLFDGCPPVESFPDDAFAACRGDRPADLLGRNCGLCCYHFYVPYCGRPIVKGGSLLTAQLASAAAWSR